MSAIEILSILNTVVTTLLGAFLVYRTFFMVYGIFAKAPQYQPDNQTFHKFAFLISARNESKVIKNLIESINKQNYPKDKITIFVVADNCTDNTAQICRDNGCVVYERYNKEKIGKGYALNFLTNHISRDYGMESFDAYFVFDADNVLSENYVAEMNKAFCCGHKIITSYRNVKNFDSNYISACYGYHQYRTLRTLNIPRTKLNLSCLVTGTGFLVSSDLLKDGWKWELITEDCEFSVDCALAGYKIVYCHSAVFFDEQPTTFKIMLRQRLRWAKGFLMVFSSHGKKLLKAMFSKNKIDKNKTKKYKFHKRFAYYDIFWHIFPSSLVLFVWGVLYNIALITANIVAGMNVSNILLSTLSSLGMSLLQLYVVTIIQVIPVIICEWKNMACSPFKKVFYLFTFPFFDLINIPLMAVAVFKKVEWKPIAHTIDTSIEKLNEKNKKYNKKNI